IPRAQNTHADRLANEAMDAQAGKAPAAKAKAKPEPQPKPAPAWTGATGKPPTLLLRRHGQTELSVQRRYSGRVDVQLTEAGRAQAAAAARRLATMPGVGADTPVISSPLSRAADTARAVAKAIGSEVDTHPGLTETDFGDWEGLTFAEAAARDPELHRRWLSDTSVPPPDGESFDAVHRRVRKTRDELLAKHGGRTLIIVSHV